MTRDAVALPGAGPSLSDPNVVADKVLNASFMQMTKLWCQVCLLVIAGAILGCNPTFLRFEADRDSLIVSYRVDRQKKYLARISREIAAFCPSQQGRVTSDTPWHARELDRPAARPPLKSAAQQKQAAASFWQQKQTGAWYVSRIKCIPAIKRPSPPRRTS